MAGIVIDPRAKTQAVRDSGVPYKELGMVKQNIRKADYFAILAGLAKAWQAGDINRYQWWVAYAKLY